MRCWPRCRSSPPATPASMPVSGRKSRPVPSTPSRSDRSMTFNSTTQWGWPAKALHWLGAAIILLLLGHGWWMTHMTPRPERLANYAGHSALGYDFLVLLVLRLLWRWFNAVPELPADFKPWGRMAAHAGHPARH